MSDTTTPMRAVLAEGEQHVFKNLPLDGRYRAFPRNGVLVLARSRQERLRGVTKAEAIAAAGRKRWCRAAQLAAFGLEAEARERSVAEVERALGVSYYTACTVVVRGREVFDLFSGDLIARLDGEGVAS